MFFFFFFMYNALIFLRTFLSSFYVFVRLPPFFLFFLLLCEITVSLLLIFDTPFLFFYFLPSYIAGFGVGWKFAIFFFFSLPDLVWVTGPREQGG